MSSTSAWQTQDVKAISPNDAATITSAETLTLLDGQHRTLAEAIAKSMYVFWLGSGISLGRVDDLKNVILRVLEFLQGKIDRSDANCSHKKALLDALGLAELSAAELDQVDLTIPIGLWTTRVDLLDRLSGKY